MTEHSQFEKSVHDALAHLYDIPYLQTHPLTHWFGPTSGSDPPGRILRRLLLETVQELKPPSDAPFETAASVRYQVLYLRYVRGESIDEVARRLAIGERQLFRKQHEALRIVTTALARRLRVSLEEDLAEPSSIGLGPDDTDRASDSVRSEIDRLCSVHPSVPIDLAQVLRGAIATVASLTDADRRPMTVKIAPSVGAVSANRVATRQAILGLLMFARNTCSEGGLSIDLEQLGHVAI
ncbi:MAG TPA: hypothetical protein VMW65_14150, partial [Chloroflexota bacterium]|nr:hypothetical protein [Chloroflexota bacterium]